MRSSPILFYILRCYKRTERQQPLPLPSSKPSERSIKGERLILCKQENIVVGYCWRLVDRSKIEWFWPAVDIYFFFFALSLLPIHIFIRLMHLLLLLLLAALACCVCGGVSLLRARLAHITTWVIWLDCTPSAKVCLLQHTHTNRRRRGTNVSYSSIEVASTLFRSVSNMQKRMQSLYVYDRLDSRSRLHIDWHFWIAIWFFFSFFFMFGFWWNMRMETVLRSTATAAGVARIYFRNKQHNSRPALAIYMHIYLMDGWWLY